MNDRILGALQRVGIQDSPVASLDHDDQFFALTAQALLYQGETGGPLNQVKLREISRIHSDHQGTLRVEAPGGTAITASLLGFDPNRVQRFFQTVRDTTARAKQLPASPLPTAPASSEAKTFSPAPSTPAPSTPTPVAPTPAAPGPLNLSPVNPVPVSPTPVSPTPVSPVTPIVIADGPEAPRVVRVGAPPAGLPASPASANPASAGPAAAPTQPAPPRPELSKPEATRIEAAKPLSVSASPTFNQPRPAEAPKAATPAPSLPPTRLPVGTPVKPAGPAASTATVPTASSPNSPNMAAAPTTALERSLQSSSLIRSAQTVGGLSMTVRILSVVLILGALGMGYFLWRQGKASQIPALWTVTMGIVTAVALNVLAEVLKLLSALGQAVAGSRE